jgi:hypothetical protein
VVNPELKAPNTSKKRKNWIRKKIIPRVTSGNSGNRIPTEKLKKQTKNTERDADAATAASPRLPEKETNAEKMATAIFFSNNNCKAESGASPELYYRFFPHRILSIKITEAFIPAFKPYLLTYWLFSWSIQDLELYGEKRTVPRERATFS